MRISTQNIACSQRQMNTCHTSFSYVLWAYGEHIMSKWSSMNIWSIHMTSIGKENRSSQCLSYKEQSRRRGWGWGGNGGGWGWGGRKAVGRTGGVVWVYKIGLKWPVIAHSSGAVWESRWTSWVVRPNEPSGFRGRKELLNRASALVTTCP